MDVAAEVKTVEGSPPEESSPAKDETVEGSTPEESGLANR